MTPADLSCPPAHGPSARFQFRLNGAAHTFCLRHGLFNPKLVKTALATAAVVGTILTAINQGNVILDGHFPAQLYWKVPLTYGVPYCVASFSAMRMAKLR